jgi:hypothetical protein
MGNETIITQALKEYIKKENNPLFTAIADLLLKYNMNDDDLMEGLGNACSYSVVDCGYFTYYGECNEFFEKFKEQINAFLSEEMEEFGYKSIIELIPKIDFVADPLLIELNSHQWITWYVFEAISHRFASKLELDC